MSFRMRSLSIALIFAGSGMPRGLLQPSPRPCWKKRGLFRRPQKWRQPRPRWLFPMICWNLPAIGASGSAIKIEFNQQSNTLEYKRLMAIALFPRAVIHTSATVILICKMIIRCRSQTVSAKLVPQTMNSADYSLVIAQGISANNPIDTSHFAGKAWLPISLPATDL